MCQSSFIYKAKSLFIRTYRCLHLTTCFLFSFKSYIKMNECQMFGWNVRINVTF